MRKKERWRERKKRERERENREDKPTQARMRTDHSSLHVLTPLGFSAAVTSYPPPVARRLGSAMPLSYPLNSYPLNRYPLNSTDEEMRCVSLIDYHLFPFSSCQLHVPCRVHSALYPCGPSYSCSCSFCSSCSSSSFSCCSCSCDIFRLRSLGRSSSSLYVNRHAS